MILTGNTTTEAPGADTTNLERNLHDAYKYTYVTLCTIVATISAFGNILVSSTILRCRKLQIATNLLLLSLVGADLLTATVMIPLHIERFLHQSPEFANKGLCLLRKYLFIITSSGSLISLTVISVDRMIAIASPFFHQRCMNKKVSGLIISGVWIWTLGYNCVMFYPNKQWELILPTCVIGIPHVTYLLVTPIGLYVPAIIFIFIYGRIYLIARKQGKRITNEKIRNSLQTSTFSNDIEVQSNVTNSLSRNSLQFDLRDFPIKKSNLYEQTLELSALKLAFNDSEKSLKRSVSDQNVSLSGKSNVLVNLNIFNPADFFPVSTPEHFKRGLSLTNLHEIDKKTISDTPSIRKLVRTQSITTLNRAVQGGKNCIRKMTRSLSRDIRAIKTIGMMVGLLLLCWLPTAILYLYLSLIGKTTSRDELYLKLAEIFMFLSFVNTAINPFLYTFRNKAMRVETVKSWKFVKDLISRN